MKNTLLWGSLLALLAAGCHASSTPDEPADSATGTGQNIMQNNPGMMAQNEQMAAAPGAPGTAPTAPAGGARAQAMRLHDAAMNRMDALSTERQRLAAALAKLNANTPAARRQAARLRRAVGALQQADDQMMDWMHRLQEPDSARQPRAQIEAYWRQQLPGLQRLDQRTAAALDSAGALR